MCCPGRFENGAYSGFGTWTLDATSYVGDWQNDAWHGRGTFTMGGGQTFEGEFEAYEFHGRGVFTRPIGTEGKEVVRGRWVHGQLHGLVISRSYLNKTGECVYTTEGPYRDGKKHGVFRVSTTRNLDGSWDLVNETYVNGVKRSDLDAVCATGCAYM